MIFLLVFFIPRFQTLFEGFDAALPALTQVDYRRQRRDPALRPLRRGRRGAAIYLGRNWLASDERAARWETVLLRTPVIGPLAAQIAMARFCRMLGTLLGAGVSLMSGLDVARRRSATRP